MFKKILLALGILLGLLIVTAGVLLATFDPNGYKSDLTRLVKDKTQRTLTVAGDIRLSLWPRLGIDLGGATLSEPNSSQTFASINSAHLSVAVLPLLRKQLVVDQVRLDGVRAALVRTRAGTTNVDDLTEGGGASTESGNAVGFDIGGIEITRSGFSLRDDLGGTSAALNNVNLKTGRITDQLPVDVDFSADIDTRQPLAQANVAVKGKVTFDLKARRYAFDGLDGRIKGSGLGARDLTLTLKGNATADLGRHSVAAQDFVLTAVGGFDAMTLSEGRLDAPKLQFDLTSGQLDVEGVKLGLAGSQGADKFDVRLQAPKLAISNAGASGEAITGSIHAGGASTADVKFTATGVEGNAKAFAIRKLALDVDARQGTRTIVGTLAASLRGNLTDSIVELPGISANFSISDPALPQKAIQLPINGNARVDLAKQVVAANLATRFDDSTIQASLGATRFAAPALTFDIGIDRIDLDRYLPPAPKGDALPARSASAAAPEKPFDFSALRTLDASGNVRIGALQAQHVKAANVAVSVHAANGALTLPTISASLYQGSLSGSAGVNVANQFGLKAMLTGIAIGPLLKDAMNRDVLDGRGNVALDVRGAGATLTALKHSLNGSGSLMLRDGAIKGINLAKTLRDFKARLAAKSITQQEASSVEKTDFTELSASFTIRNGIASNSDLLVKTPLLRLGGAGDIDLGAGRIDYVARAMVVNTATGQDGKDLKQLKDVTIPVHVTGPFSKLSYSIDWMAISSAALTNTLKDKIGEKLGGKAGDDQSTKPADQLRNTLKNLLGR